MASGKSPFALIYAPAAVDNLHEIWIWNLQAHGLKQADAYAHFLSEMIRGLGLNPASGKAVVGRPGLLYTLVRRRKRGHGHVLVYTVREGECHLLHVFHTAQDWVPKLDG